MNIPNIKGLEAKFQVALHAKITIFPNHKGTLKTSLSEQ